MPAVEVKHLFEGVGDAGPGAADPHDGVVDRCIVELDVAAPLWVERRVPVRRHVSHSSARYAQYLTYCS